MRLLFAFLLGSLALSFSCRADPQPMTLKEVGLMLRSGYSSDVVLQEVVKRRVTEQIDDASEKALLQAGASPQLLKALAGGSYTVSPAEAEQARQSAEETAARQEKEAERIYQTATKVLRAEQQRPAAAQPGAPLAGPLKDKLVTMADGTLSPADDSQFEKKKLIAFYFSAGWCAPCRRFTPQLVAYYNKVEPQHPEFEIVFYGFDHTRFNWETYMRTDRMPWLAIAYDQLDALSGLKQIAGEEIPSLVLVDDTGHVLSTSYDGQKYVGPQKVLDDLEKIWAAPTNPTVSSR